MDIKVKRNNLILLCCTQRSLTTVFLRVCMNDPKIKIFNDPFSSFYFGLYFKGLTTLKPEEWLIEFNVKVEKLLEEGFTVIIKDMSAVFLENYPKEIGPWLEKYKPKLLHLLRHPRARIASYKKKLDVELEVQKAPIELYNYYLNQETYEACLIMYKKYGGKILITERLQADPVSSFARCFEYFGLEFSEDLLTYEPLKEIPEDIKYFARYYTECFESTSFKAGVTDIEKIELDPSLEEAVAKSIDFYNEMKNSEDQI